MSDLYDRDFYAWANEQAALLRAERAAELDWTNIAEEIESMGRSEKRELVSRLEVLLLHLLKWRFQPEKRGRSWEVSIANTRDALIDHLEDNPSLKSTLPEAVRTAYRRARRTGGIETGLEDATFPLDCPWTFEQVMGDELPS
jgi:predicted  nucleic acid-binding Zn-ribbon protein